MKTAMTSPRVSARAKDVAQRIQRMLAGEAKRFRVGYQDDDRVFINVGFGNNRVSVGDLLALADAVTSRAPKTRKTR